MLEDLKAGAEDARAGIKGVVNFFKIDGVVFNHCDDSRGAVGGVYRYDASELFVHYAQGVPRQGLDL